MATYNITSVDMDLLGGSCETWTIRTVDNILHPFHIHVSTAMFIVPNAHL